MFSLNRTGQYKRGGTEQWYGYAEDNWMPACSFRLLMPSSCSHAKFGCSVQYSLLIYPIALTLVKLIPISMHSCTV